MVVERECGRGEEKRQRKPPPTGAGASRGANQSAIMSRNHKVIYAYIWLSIHVHEGGRNLGGTCKKNKESSLEVNSKPDACPMSPPSLRDLQQLEAGRPGSTHQVDSSIAINNRSRTLIILRIPIAPLFPSPINTPPPPLPLFFFFFASAVFFASLGMAQYNYATRYRPQ
ncbi:hypothetical protein GGS23DRAFT_198029 [Durotheca rogersii]|uniref:uncharacterized protein n=1 Tax=Durotheca rogersii TaxID=419775 RepID=UPI00221FF907|nr:uncharacterized protein GGS23DRAFT_198029 [Durotheca rogersii]KAI5867819.1 hypothetical protein GGS23DRAFT_198029 [Durotheca rogersii]